MVLLDMGRREDAVVQFLTVYKDYSKTKEGQDAFLKLQEIAPESVSTTPTTPPIRKPTPTPRKP
jgi:hypothetical protein